MALVIVAACGHSPPQPSGPSASMQRLTIVISSARHIMDTGYSLVYRAPVEKVIEGKLADRAINIHVFFNRDGSLYSGRFRAFEEAAATLRFSRVPEGSDMYEGFTATDGTRWKLVSVDAK